MKERLDDRVLAYMARKHAERDRRARFDPLNGVVGITVGMLNVIGSDDAPISIWLFVLVPLGYVLWIIWRVVTERQPL